MKKTFNFKLILIFILIILGISIIIHDRILIKNLINSDRRNLAMRNRKSNFMPDFSKIITQAKAKNNYSCNTKGPNDYAQWSTANFKNDYNRKSVKPLEGFDFIDKDDLLDYYYIKHWTDSNGPQMDDLIMLNNVNGWDIAYICYTRNKDNKTEWCGHCGTL